MAATRTATRAIRPVVDPLRWGIPASRFRRLVGAGHAPQFDLPRTIVRLVHEATGAAGKR